ncbi:MAG: hypothetical protein Q7V88_12950 [Actinomycetota bacterium]|nr:hypothetical protein [Actinomycetota bacterium]
MSEDREPTQTTVAGETIPVPTRDDVMDAFRKVAKLPAQQEEDDPDD